MMERHLYRGDWQHGKLTIEITDAAHFVESLNWAEDQGISAEFIGRFAWFLRMALGRVIPRNESEYEGTKIHAQPGKEGKLTISPDAYNEPSFLWSEDKGMNGGLIYHPSSKTWGIHT